MTPREQFFSGRFQELAEQIDSGSYDANVARVLTVVNPHPQAFTGTVAFPVWMRWEDRKPLPPIRIFDPLTLTDAPHRVDRLTHDAGRVAFDLVFAVTAVPVDGYKSYLAEYAAVSGPPLPPGSVSSECLVVETLPHPGTLPWIMSFG